MSGHKDARIHKLEHELKQWKMHHAHQVAKCTLLTQTPNVPVERIQAYTELERLQNLETELRSELFAKDEMLNALESDNIELYDKWYDAQRFLNKVDYILRKAKLTIRVQSVLCLALFGIGMLGFASYYMIIPIFLMLWIIYFK